MKQYAIGLLVLLPLNTVWATEYSVEFAVEAQAFNQAGSPLSHEFDLSFRLEPSFRHQNEAGDLFFTATAFGRVDQHDDERTHADIRELKVLKVIDQWEVEAGLSKVFWGVAEANHLVDIINQTDYLEGLDGEDKLGQPMIRLSRAFEQSTLTALVLPGFRQRAFVGPKSRFTLPFFVDVNRAQFESDDKDKHVDFALRFSGYLGQMDYGLSWFKGTSREAQLLPISPASNAALPFYAQIERLGIDIQYTAGAWLWKLEAIDQESKASQYHAAVAGLEYTFYGLNDGAYDLGVISEINYDSRDDAQTVMLQNDLFVGGRFAFNDTESSSILLGSIIDLDDDSRSFRLEASRRVLGDANLNVEAQVFSHTDPSNLLYGFRDNDFAKIELTWYF